MLGKQPATFTMMLEDGTWHFELVGDAIYFRSLLTSAVYYDQQQSHTMGHCLQAACMRSYRLLAAAATLQGWLSGQFFWRLGISCIISTLQTIHIQCNVCYVLLCRLLHEELKAAGSSGHLAGLVGSAVGKALRMIAEKAEYMAAAGPELRQVRCQWCLQSHQCIVCVAVC
jgi:hypothetical protein